MEVVSGTYGGQQYISGTYSTTVHQRPSCCYCFCYFFCMVRRCCIYIIPVTLSLYFVVCSACIFFWSSPSCWSVTAIPSVYSFDFVSRHILEGSSSLLFLSLYVVYVVFTLFFHVSCLILCFLIRSVFVRTS
jgi:hypothetical protein